MKVGDWREAHACLQEHLETRAARFTIRDLPGETFFDPTGWRFLVTKYNNSGSIFTHAIWRVGPRGGCEAVLTVTRAQWDYLRGLLS